MVRMKASIFGLAEHGRLVDICTPTLPLIYTVAFAMTLAPLPLSATTGQEEMRVSASFRDSTSPFPDHFVSVLSPQARMQTMGKAVE